jgi:transcriptional regulator with XRE-family HTH domain
VQLIIPEWYWFSYITQGDNYTVVIEMALRQGAGRPALDVPEGNGFGAWLRAERSKRGWSGETLAFRANMTQGMVSSYERGAKAPRRETIVKLARALAPDGASEEEIERIVADGLLAAGFLPSPGGNLPEIERMPDETILAQIESYDGENETLRGFKGFLKARAESHEVPPPDDVGAM